MMNLDNHTILFTLIFVGICLFFYSLFAGSQFERGHIVLYRLSNLVYSLGFIFLYFQGYGYKFLSIVVANNLILIGVILFLLTVLTLLQIGYSLKIFVSVVIIHFTLFIIFTFIHPSTLARIIIIALSISIIMAYSVYLTFKTIDLRHESYATLSIGTSIFYIIISIFRIIFTYNTNYKIESIFKTDTATSIIFMATIAYHVSINSVIFLLFNDISSNELKDKVRLLETSYQDIRNINTFFNDNNHLTYTSELYNRISEFLYKRFSIDACSFFLTNYKNNTLDLVYKKGFPPEVNQFEQKISLDYTSSAVNAYNSDSLVSFSIEDYPDNDLKEILKDNGFKIIYSLPIRSLTGNIGVMSIGCKSDNSSLEKELDIFTLTTNQIGTIIENANRYDILKNQADTDPLTGILNRREFFVRCSHLISRVKRYSRPASLIIIDIDYFKSVNDVYGHSTGDEVLKRCVDQIKSMLRETDLLGRFGGEEFLVLLDETVVSDGYILAERIRSNIEKLTLNINNSIIHYTVSMGITQFINEDSIESAFSRADKALYRAKKTGRNRVIIE